MTLARAISISLSSKPVARQIKIDGLRAGCSVGNANIVAEILFCSENLEVRYVAGRDTSRHVITFDPWHAETTFDRPGFGEEFFARQGISATIILTRGNDWYQYPEIAPALDAARLSAATAEQVMTYGTSMGAYAAIRFADAVGANATLALSPQYSVDRCKVPFEDRWGQDQRRIRFLDAVDGPVRSAHAPIIFYDSADRDSYHALKYAADIATVPVPIPHGGHPIITYLAEAGVLGAIVFGALDGTFEPQATIADLHTRRRTMAFYHVQLAAAQPSWRQQTALALSQKARQLKPDSPLANHGLAKQLAAVGRYPEAITSYEETLALGVRFPTVLYDYVTALLAVGDYERALTIVEELASEMPANVDILHLMIRVLQAQGNHGRALRTAWAVRRLDPTHRHYRKLLRRAFARWALNSIAMPITRAVRRSSKTSKFSALL